MKFIFHEHIGGDIAELSGKEQRISNVEDAVDLLGNANYQGARRIVVHQFQLHPDFFELKSGLAGDILQKFSNYRMQLAIVGDFHNISSKSLRAFIYESNKQGRIFFVDTLKDALARLSAEN